MARKSPDSGGATATAERKTRTRKTPTEKIENLTARVINALRKLACIEMPESHREQVDQAIDREKVAMKQAWDAMDEEPKDDAPDTFTLK